MYIFATVNSPTTSLPAVIDELMNEELQHLSSDPDGMMTYEYIVNNVDQFIPNAEFLTENLKRVDLTGQFLASTSRFLCAIDRERFLPCTAPLIEAAIDKDRERRYISSLLEAIWGHDYQDHVDELNASDNNFRRIYKRIYPERVIPRAYVCLEDE